MYRQCARRVFLARKFSTSLSVRTYVECVCVCRVCTYVFPIVLVGSVSLSKKKFKKIYKENASKRKCVSALWCLVKNPK